MKTNKTPVALYKNNQLFFIHTDYLETPRAITNNSQAVVWKWDNIDPFGKNAPTNLGIDFNLRFMGQYSDNETGLFYNYYRYYNPTTGRYIQPDPIGLAGGIDLYSYARQNPVNFTDPLGLSEKDILILKKEFYKAVKEMTDKHMRLPGDGGHFTNYNNFIAKACNPNVQNPDIAPILYMPYNFFTRFSLECSENDKKIEYCDGQSTYVSRKLNNLLGKKDNDPTKLDDDWKIVSQNNSGHFWLVAMSSNLNDPILYIDAWREEFSIGKPCRNCTNGSPIGDRPSYR